MNGKENTNAIFITRGIEIDYSQSKTGLFNFGLVEIDSSCFNEGKLSEKSIVIEIHESMLDKKDNVVQVMIG